MPAPPQAIHHHRWETGPISRRLMISQYSFSNSPLGKLPCPAALRGAKWSWPVSQEASKHTE